MNQSELPVSLGLVGSFDPQFVFVLLILIALLMVVGFVIILNRKQKRGKPPAEALPEKEKPADFVRPAPSASTAEVEVAERPEAPVVEAPPKVEKPTDRERLNRGLGKASLFLQQALDRVLGGSEGEKFYQDLEEALLMADVGIGFAEEVIGELRKRLGLRVPKRDELYSLLKDVLHDRVPEFPENPLVIGDGVDRSRPYIVMVVGVNGAGKTTTVGKLCHYLQAYDKKILVGAADTFRAAATEQLRQWVDRVGAQGVFQKEGADPSAVAFDTVQAAKNRDFDVALIDTAGRLHTKHNLMDELQKMKRVMGKADPEAKNQPPHDVWLVVDGSTGQNALMQAREFHKALGLTGIIITKLDGSAKGGVVLGIMSELKVPVLMVGVGESAEDLIRFDRDEFIEALLSGLK